MKSKKKMMISYLKDHFPPTPYTVEEPCENPLKRTSRMKRLEY